MTDVTPAPSADYQDTRVVDPPVQNAAADAEEARRESGDLTPTPEEQFHIDQVEDIIAQGEEVATGAPNRDLPTPQQDDVDQQDDQPVESLGQVQPSQPGMPPMQSKAPTSKKATS